MVTPSHNPAQDNGYKVYWENGAQIIPPFDSLIQNAIMANLDLWPGAQVDLFHKAVDCSEAVESAYLAKARTTLNWHRADNKATDLRVVFTPMHGVGKEPTRRMLEEFGLPPYVATPEQIEPHPDFPTVKFPNPEEPGALDLAMAHAERSGLSLVVAEDPDSDRFACAERQPDGTWVVFTGNEIALLLGHWALTHYPKERRADAVMLASTVSSKILRAISQHPEDGGFSFEETLTGFKWMGNRAVELEAAGKTLLFAFEVEIGFVIGDMSVDKDGVRALACFNELAIQCKNKGITVKQHLEALYARYGYYVMVNSYFRGPSVRHMDGIFAQLRKDGQYASSIGGFKVESVRDLTTGLDTSRPDKRTTLYVDPTANMITYTLEGGASVTVRTSGTEPKLKYYVECSDAHSKDHAKEKLARITKGVVDELIKPTEFGLEGPPQKK